MIVPHPPYVILALLQGFNQDIVYIDTGAKNPLSLLD